MRSIPIVDDDPSNRDLLEAVLAPAGYTVRMASGGPLALEAVRRERPDLVLLDLMMPGMNGLEVLAALLRMALSLDVERVLAGLPPEILLAAIRRAGHQAAARRAEVFLSARIRALEDRLSTSS